MHKFLHVLKESIFWQVSQGHVPLVSVRYVGWLASNGRASTWIHCVVATRDRNSMEMKSNLLNQYLYGWDRDISNDCTRVLNYREFHSVPMQHWALVCWLYGQQHRTLGFNQIFALDLASGDACHFRRFIVQSKTALVCWLYGQQQRTLGLSCYWMVFILTLIVCL